MGFSPAKPRSLAGNAGSPRLRLAWLLALLLTALGFGLRMVDLRDPPLDFHATRQLRAALVARTMYYDQAPGVSAAQRQQAYNLSRTTGQYEPPILERLVAWTYLALGKEALWVSRIYTSLFWAIGGLALFALALKLSQSNLAPTNGVAPATFFEHILPAAIALGYYQFLPFAIQASRSFQPDPGMTMWVLLAILALVNWRDTSQAGDRRAKSRGWGWAILSGIFGGLAVLTKAVSVFMIAIPAVVVVLQAFGWRRFWRSLQVWAMALLMIAPSGLYYFFGRQGRAAEYLGSWTISLSHLLLSPTMYIRWSNLLVELMGLGALTLAIVGVALSGLPSVKAQANALRPHSFRPVLLALWGGYILYGLTLPYQIYTHTYYHLQFVPILALSLAPALQPVCAAIGKQGWFWRALAVAGLLASMGFSAYNAALSLKAKDYSNDPPFWQEVGALLPQDGKTVALTQEYGFPLAYYGNRKVSLWPIVGELKLAEMRGKGKTFAEYFSQKTNGRRYFLITAYNQLEQQPDLAQYLVQNFAVLAQGEGYVIYDLAAPAGAIP